MGTQLELRKKIRTHLHIEWASFFTKVSARVNVVNHRENESIKLPEMKELGHPSLVSSDLAITRDQTLWTETIR